MGKKKNEMRGNHEKRCAEMRRRNGFASKGIRRPKGNRSFLVITREQVANVEHIVHLRNQAREWCRLNCGEGARLHTMFCVQTLWNESGQLLPFSGDVDQVNIAPVRDSRGKLSRQEKAK